MFRDSRTCPAETKLILERLPPEAATEYAKLTLVLPPRPLASPVIEKLANVGGPYWSLQPPLPSSAYRRSQASTQRADAPSPLAVHEPFGGLGGHARTHRPAPSLEKVPRPLGSTDGHLARQDLPSEARSCVGGHCSRQAAPFSTQSPTFPGPLPPHTGTQAPPLSR